MTRRARGGLGPRALAAVAGLLLLGGAREPILVPDVSQHEVLLRQGFTGTELLLFGALLTPEGTPAGRSYDIVVVLKGPTQSVVVREKQKVAGIWLNADSTELRSAPSFYAVASSHPISRIVDDRTAAIYELGLQWLQLSPIGAINPAEQTRFAAGLVDLRRRGKLFQQNDGGVSIKNGVLYQARFRLPSNIPTGTYTAETFAIQGGRVVTSAISSVEVRKIGAEEVIANLAQDYSLFYGVLTVLVAVAMGWIAGRLFALV